MIGEALIDLFFSTFMGMFGALEIFQLPTQLMGALTNILVYGNWIVGIDVIGLFVGSVVFWWGVHLSIGLAVWLWKMLPLT